MLFNVKTFILGLAALSSIPEGLGRAVPRTTVDAVALYKYGGNFQARGAPVRIGGGDRGGTGSGGRGNGEGDGTSSGGGTHIGEGDGAGGNGDRGSEAPVHIGAGDNNSNNNAGGANKQVDVTSPEYLSSRGETGIKLVAAPEKSKEDYTGRYVNYKFKGPKTPEGVEYSIPKLGLDQKYGFQNDKGWQTMKIFSTNNEDFELAKMSYGTVQKDGKEYTAIVAHERYADRDGNRYKLDGYSAAKDDKGKLIPSPDKDTKSVPVYQLVYEAGVKSKQMQQGDKLFLVSESIQNEAAKTAIPRAYEAMGKKDNQNEVLTFRNGAPGAEGEQFKILAGLDNNWSFLNTVGKNPDFFKDYKLVSLTTNGDPRTMSLDFDKIVSE
ncbi:hypothetical protein PG984_005652 [Apiospora sp. TS-2023a]